MIITKNIFRLIVATSLLIIVIAICLDFFSLSKLPPELEYFVQKQDANSLEVGPFFTVFLLFGLMALIGNIGLLFFAKWSPFVFTVGVVFSAIGALTYGPSVQTALQSTLYEIDTLLTGFIIALIYFSNVSDYFKGENT